MTTNPTSFNTTSFKQFWHDFNSARRGLVKKLDNAATRAPASAGKVGKDTNQVLGWEFRPVSEDTFDGFRIVMDSPYDPFDWFATFVKKNRDLLVDLLTKNKVDISGLKVQPPAKIVFMTLKFDPTTTGVLVQDQDLQTKCIAWGNDNAPRIFKAALQYHHQFTLFVADRCAPGENSVVGFHGNK
jgi:hypothetical protein